MSITTYFQTLILTKLKFIFWVWQACIIWVLQTGPKHWMLEDQYRVGMGSYHVCVQCYKIQDTTPRMQPSSIRTNMTSSDCVASVSLVVFRGINFIENWFRNSLSNHQNFSLFFRQKAEANFSFFGSNIASHWFENKQKIKGSSLQSFYSVSHRNINSSLHLHQLLKSNKKSKV